MKNSHTGYLKLFDFLSRYRVAGQDASDEFTAAFHSDIAKEQMLPLRVGRLVLVAEPGTVTQNKTEEEEEEEEIPVDLVILYGSQTGTSQGFAQRVFDACTEKVVVFLSVFFPHPYLLKLFDHPNRSGAASCARWTHSNPRTLRRPN